MKNLTLIIPTKNEKESLPIFLQEINDLACKKIIVIDNEDKVTEQVLESFSDIKIINQKKSGYGNALIEGINASTTEFCCIINADGSMDPKFLGEKIKLASNYDFVFSSRYLNKDAGSEDDDLITLVGNYFFSFLGRLFFSLPISDILYTYILGRTTSFQKLDLNYHDFRICVEIPIKSKRKNYSIIDIPSYERKRIGGKKKVSPFKDGILILFAMVSLFFKKK